MANDILRLKTDILNDLRNERYYVLDELQHLVDAEGVAQIDKVKDGRELIARISGIDRDMATVESLFLIPAPQPQGQPEPVNGDQATSSEEPTNVVEAPVEPVAEPVLNQQGQSHSE